MKAAICAALLAMCLCAPVARADLYSAKQAYDKGELEHAFELYQELAELGDMRAQEYLAAMYVAGEGVKRNNLMGYAWASIAIENGAGDEMKSIISQLDSHMTDSARKQVDAIKAQYGSDALRKSLLPDIYANASYIDREPCKVSKAMATIYPQDAVDKGIQGNAYVEVTVMPDGRARNPRVVYAIPTGVFDEAAREAMLRTEFTPARTRKGGLVPCTYAVMLRYVIEGYETSDYPKLEVFAKQTREKAESGDPNAQMLYGLLISGFPQLKQNRSDAMPWFLKSAQAGVPTAQFTIGYSMMEGWGCQCDEPKGMIWLHKAAAADQADAQVALANYLLRGDPGPEEVAKATKWLERAVANNHRDAKIYLAALLATGPDPARRDPQRSLTMLHDVMHSRDVDPTEFEIRAAAYAALGNFKEAQLDQSKALKMAQKLGWDVAPQQQRLNAYVAKTPWSGDLFAF